MDNEQVTSYPVEFLNSLELSRVPFHKLRLKDGVPILLIRNLDEPILSNGTRLKITQLGPNIVRATVMTQIAILVCSEVAAILLCKSASLYVVYQLCSKLVLQLWCEVCHKYHIVPSY
ncbi:hypothetical protein AVEN_128080-1 [Araneus ventricosus]|uniref:DNA helicase Pif1-like 2B domain-containing protein n=1 Tax=Araneus ventricosus TaxID=182803 RepID=A0A4Y2A010_ARAVE|nr:hypothetical protein AVEN_128080-1 [Araneus ventricosus]